MDKQKMWLQILVWLIKGVITLEEGLFLLGQKMKIVRLLALFSLKKSQYNNI